MATLPRYHVLVGLQYPHPQGGPDEVRLEPTPRAEPVELPGLGAEAIASLIAHGEIELAKPRAPRKPSAKGGKS